ncbi:MAG: tetratricopeptide repeat protein [Acidobacteria bacterium]|nr:tetratricopeptide repeat protein [Acidobacteriota bacterium]
MAARAAALELRRADLASRREDLLGRLSQSGLQQADRTRLQVSAARVLKELDEVEEAIAGIAPDTGGKRQPTAATAGNAFAQAHPLLSGALLGGGVVGLVAALVIWAQIDARPDPQAEQAMAQGSGETDFRGQAPLPPELASRAVELQRQIDADPSDLDAMRALMQLLLTNGRAFDAFQVAQQILQVDPEDPDAHFVSGMVRLQMGQTQVALSAFERSLRSDPGHEQSALMQGLLLLQFGDRDGAIATWEGANQVRSSPRLEQVAAQAREGKTVDEIVNNPL